MPELPEVETICRGLAPHLVGQRVAGVVVRREDLRHPMEGVVLQSQMTGQIITALERRGKYLGLSLERGGVLVHLGMSGVLRWLARPDAPGRHDHVDVLLEDGSCLRFHDPRRFGAFLWVAEGWQHHPLLARLGVEPLSPACTGENLAARAGRRRQGVRDFLMDSHQVVGIGNIYAAEICHQAALHPLQPIATLTLEQWQQVVKAMHQVLQAAIAQGGTTLKDFRNGEGKPGYFQQQLQVYGRQGEPCGRCGGWVQRLKKGGRSIYFCAACQPLAEPC